MGKVHAKKHMYRFQPTKRLETAINPPFKTVSPLLMIHGSYQEGPTRQLNEKYRASYRLQKSSTDYHHSPIPCGDSRRLKTTLILNHFYKRVYLIYS